MSVWYADFISVIGTVDDVDIVDIVDDDVTLSGWFERRSDL